MIITLASTSPRRRELIKLLGLKVEAVSPNCDENVEGLFGAAYAVALAQRKAESVIGEVVVGADTIVVVAGEILGKPSSPGEARTMFRKLCGTKHSVITGVCVRRGDVEILDSETSEVRFKRYDERLVEEYIASGKCFDKAGGYGIQDEEIKLLTAEIIGDLNNIIGLPTRLLRGMLGTITNE